MGTNDADYSKLQKNLDQSNGGALAVKTVNAFANLRPQHFTDAMLVRPYRPKLSLYSKHDLSGRGRKV
jgi:hypothetical protein